MIDTNMFKVRKGNMTEELRPNKTHPYTRLMQYFIDIELFDKYQANVTHRQMKHLVHADMATRDTSMVLTSSFVYADTKEGVKFWQKVQDELPIGL